MTKQVKSVIESVLFYWAEPMALEDISELVDLPSQQTAEILKEMRDEYIHYQRGIRLKIFNDSYQLVTNPDHSAFIDRLTHRRVTKSISSSAMEVLSIIAYKQPVTRIEVDAIRGVNSSGVISGLIERGLIMEKGKLDRIGRPNLYGTTDEFLRVFGLESLNQLPKLDLKLEEVSNEN